MSGPDDDTTTKGLWIIASVVAFVLFAAVVLLSWHFHWTWASNLWFNYAWSSDKGNGPEAIQQTIIYALAAVLLIPPLRHAMEAFAKRHVDSIKEHASKEHDAIHEKLDHLIANHSNAAGRDFTATKERPVRPSDK